MMNRRSVFVFTVLGIAAAVAVVVSRTAWIESREVEPARRQVPAAEVDDGLAELFATVATSADMRAVASGSAELTGDRDVDTVAACAAEWLTTDAEGADLLRNVFDVYALVGDAAPEILGAYVAGDDGGEEHGLLRSLLGAEVTPVIRSRLHRLLRENLLNEMFDALTALYGDDPDAARALAMDLLRASFDGGLSIPVFSACTRCDSPSNVLQIARVIGGAHLAGATSAQERASAVTDVVVHIAIPFGLALGEGDEGDERAMERVVLERYGRLLREWVGSGRYSLVEGLIAVYAIRPSALEDAEAPALLVMLARDSEWPSVRRAALGVFAKAVGPSELVASVPVTTSIPRGDLESRAQTEVFRALFASVQAHGDAQGVAADLLRAQLARPADTDFGRTHQALIIRLAPAELVAGLGATLDRLVSHAGPRIRAAVESARRR